MQCKKCKKDPCVCQEEEDKQYRFDSRFIIDVARRKEAMKQRRQQQREEKRKDETEK